MAPSAFEKLEADRKSIRDHLEFLESELNRHAAAPLTLQEAIMYMAELEDTRKLIGPNHREIILLAPKATDMNPYVAEYRSLSALSCRLFSGFHGIKASFPPPTPPPTAPGPTPSGTSSLQQKIKLPPLELPKFSGNLQEWVTFRDLFITAVHNSTLTKVEKLTQLKVLLTGEASRQIRSLVLSDTNYDIAWKSLTDRYENNRELLFSILKRMLTQPPITSSNATSVRSLIDTTKECTRSLEVLSIPTQHWDAIILYLLFSKLDAPSRELWEQSLPDTSIPPLSKMFEFLEQRARALAASTVPATIRPQAKQQQAVRAHHITPESCKFGCSQPHQLFRCTEFLKQSPQTRLDNIKKFKNCMNCLSEGHAAVSCKSKSNCKTCNRRHHTLLHLENGKIQQQLSSDNSSSSATTSTQVQSHHANQMGSLRTGILATARVLINTDSGSHLRRALIDPGSTNSYITERAARAMNLRLRTCHVPMTGLSAASVGVAKYVTSFDIYPHFNANFLNKTTTTALVVKSITSSIPAEHLRREQWSHLETLQLADPDFHIPGTTDILLGTEIVWSLLDNQRIEGAPGQPYAVKSALGWLVAGPNTASHPITVFNTNADLDKSLRRFWEQEEVFQEPSLTPEEDTCEHHFTKTHHRDAEGRFTVSLPLRQDHELGTSRQQAVRRFLSLEKRYHPNNIQDTEKLRKLSEQWNMYKEFMKEYEDLNHMSVIPLEEVHSTHPTYYIPHHSVEKETSTTTKLRVVFDASATTTNGKSLNDVMMVGPTLQDNIWDIMMRFRTHIIAFTADIAKMYRQIRVEGCQTDLQRIVWRNDPSQPLKDYRLSTVTYGTAAAPYLAVRCLRQLAVDERNRFPRASKVALTDFYVDDTASGCSTLEDAIETVKELRDLCMSGGFELRKWTSNSNELLDTIPEELRETNSQVHIQEDFSVKTLGVYWSPKPDIYFFKLTLPPDMPGMYTKRIVLSEIARIYDPLGWLAPAIITCKIFMQQLWKVQLGWDEKLPNHLQDHWMQLRKDLQGIENIQIQRCVIPFSPKRLILIGCCDASTKAISAAIYLHTQNHTQSSCQLLTAKTKVAPVKHVTLPRLELNGALLLAKLINSTMKSLKLKVDEIRAYTDSTIVLHWIHAEPVKWDPYVRRRVQEIHDISTARWFHIPGSTNPADCATRGISADDLTTHPLWWHGADFFSYSSQDVNLRDEDIKEIEREAKAQVHHVNPKPLSPILLKYSSFLTLQRVVAYLFRFANNWCRRHRNTPLQLGSLTVNEISTAHNFIIRTLQRACFSSELQLLSMGQPLPNSSSLLRLQPFLSMDGILRVGGRLKNSRLSFGQKHPILLPKGHPVTTAIIEGIHRRHLHAGASSTLAAVQQRYWVVNGRDTVRAVIRKCVTCTRFRANFMNQVMGDLPLHRVQESRPFSRLGVDYAGPFTIRPMVRSKVSLKCWIAVFVCFITKAIHIEVVSSLSTDCFIAAFRRFISRRGNPTDVYSDCGTNFVGANKILKEFFTQARQLEIQEKCSVNQINWHFNPPGAPHFGGLWEAGVKSIKHHLIRVMGNSTFTYEEMLTLVTQIEGILNSRPIVPASSDPADLGALTPAHFLTGAPITALPEPCLTDQRANYLKRWQLIQQRQQQFWKRWSNEYLTRLQQRPKWMKSSPELEVGHLVLIKDERLPPLKWRLGRVTAVHPGSDGHVRVASLLTSDGEIKRPVVKLSLLPIFYK